MVAIKPSIKLYCKDARSMSDVEDSSVHLIITSPPYFDLKNYNENNNHDNQLGSPKSYMDYIKSLNTVWKDCIRILAPDGKLCINIMPIFLSGNETDFKRRVTKTVITDIEKFMESTEEMYLHSLYI